MSVKAKAILPVRFKVKAITDDLEALAQEIVDDIKIDLDRTAATWNQKPKFERSVKRTNKEITAEASTDDRLYGFINHGTSRGYAEMSKGWSPKTKPNVIGSFPGSGRRRRLNFFRPKPGVIARNFTTVIAEKHQKIIVRKAQHFLSKAAKSSGHSWG